MLKCMETNLERIDKQKSYEERNHINENQYNETIVNREGSVPLVDTKMCMTRRK